MNESIALSKLNAQRFAEVSTLYSQLAQVQEKLDKNQVLFEQQCKSLQTKEDDVYKLTKELDNLYDEKEGLKILNNKYTTLLDNFKTFEWYDLDNIQIALLHLQDKALEENKEEYQVYINIIETFKEMFNQINAK